jgi:dsRNA-specific ribonuclease
VNHCRYIHQAPNKPDHRKEFIVTLKIGEEVYKGTGNSKKKAKVIAAAACMEEKVGHCQYNTAAMVCRNLLKSI